MKAKIHGQIYLLGELHCEIGIMERQLELWHKFYHKNSIRYLFLEHCASTAAFLNIWMHSDTDEILEMLYETALAENFPYIKDWFRAIKNDCPETVFYGTTPAYPPIGEMFLQYLENNNQTGSDRYLQTQNDIEKAKQLYKKYGGEWSDAVREKIIVENFINEFEKLEGKSVVGIYGVMHTVLEPTIYFGDVPCLGYQLKERFGEAVHTEDLTIILHPEGYRHFQGV